MCDLIAARRRPSGKSNGPRRRSLSFLSPSTTNEPISRICRGHKTPCFALIMKVQFASLIALLLPAVGTAFVPSVRPVVVRWLLADKEDS
jgi:hypothetical protein